MGGGYSHEDYNLYIFNCTRNVWPQTTWTWRRPGLVWPVKKANMETKENAAIRGYFYALVVLPAVSEPLGRATTPIL